MDLLKLFNKQSSSVARAFENDVDIPGLFHGLYKDGPRLKAGVLVTDELQQAIDECTAQVDRISKACRAKNRKFRDTEFDLESERDLCLHGLDTTDDESYSPADVRRATDIFHEPKFFIDGAGSSDVVQGVLGDCWFLSALAIMTTSEGLVEKCCVKRDEKVGVYGFVFYRNKSWVPVIIDDLLYTKIRKYEDLSYEEQQLYHEDKKQYNMMARKGSKTLFFASSGTQGETWVPLIEKAYAKLHGCYGYLNGGWSGEGIEDMTGGVNSFIQVKDILDPDAFWKDELLNVTKNRLFGCVFWGNNIEGLISCHAYSILRAVEFRGKRFLVIRNPWGQSEWTGAWSDGAKEWTQDGGWLDALPVLQHKFGNDGEFVMEYSDFLQTFELLDRTFLFDETWVMSTHWLNVKARELPSAWSYGDVSFTFTIPNPTKTVITLSQVDNRYFKDLTGRSSWSFEFTLYKRDEPDILAESTHSANFTDSRSVNVELDLQPGDYVVHVRLDRQFSGEEHWYKKKLEDWDKRKLSRILMQRAQSVAIAQNFDPKTEAVHTPLPTLILAGQDIATLEKRAKEVADAKLQEAKKDEPKEQEVTTTTVVTTTMTTTIVSKKGATGEKPEENDKKAPASGSDGAEAEDTSKAADENDDKDEGKEEKTDDKRDEDDSDDTSSTSSSSSSSDDAPNTSDFTISDNHVVLGLAVYTHKDSPAVISGQVREESTLAPGLAGLALAADP